MSGNTGRRDTGRGEAARAQLPLLDRLIDDAPGADRDPPMSVAEAMTALRRSVRRDLEALLNARRRWRSWPAGYGELKVSPLGFGIPDFSAGGVNDPRSRERLRAEIEETIRLYEPRFATVRVSLIETPDRLESTLRLRIEALLHAEPAPEPVAFDTLIDPTTADVAVRQRDDV
jgi:type VI secretion system protein ImpF